MDWIPALAGFAVGALVGITGVGGGSLMTPLLLLYGIPQSIAVGTDLAYAAIAKSPGVWLRHRARAVDWRVAGLLMLGSLPASVLVIGLVEGLALQGARLELVITRVLAVALIGTRLGLSLREAYVRGVLGVLLLGVGTAFLIR